MIQMQKTYKIGPKNPNSIVASNTTEVHKMNSTVVESKIKKSKSKNHKKDKYCDSQKLEIDETKIKDFDEKTSFEFSLQTKESEIKFKRKKKKDKSKCDTKLNVAEISKEEAVIKKKSKKDKKKRKENREK